VDAARLAPFDHRPAVWPPPERRDMSRWLGPLVRVLLLGTFVWYLYSVKFAPYRDQPFDGVEPAVRAVNAGYPFQLLYRRWTASRRSWRRCPRCTATMALTCLWRPRPAQDGILYGPSFRVSSSMARTACFSSSSSQSR